MKVEIGVTKDRNPFIQVGKEVCQKNRIGEWFLYRNLGRKGIKVLEQVDSFDSGLKKLTGGK